MRFALSLKNVAANRQSKCLREIWRASCGLGALYPDLGKIPIIILIFPENAPLFPKNLQFFLIFVAKMTRRAMQFITYCQNRFYEPTAALNLLK